MKATPKTAATKSTRATAKTPKATPKPAATKPAKPTRAAAKKAVPAPAKNSAARKSPAKKTAATPTADAKRHRVFGYSFASLYPLYLQKVQAKGRTREELDRVIAWLTGYEGAGLQRVIDAKVDLEAFFDGAPRWTPHAELITGVVCGVRVEEVTDPLMRKIRYLDKLVDELARGKKLESVLRA